MLTKLVPAQPSQLRADAEARLAKITPDRLSLQSAKELLHELRVHQVELEIQNEELRATQIKLTKTRDRYVDLYDFAPIAYVTLTASGAVTNINHTGASLLAVERGPLLAEVRHATFERFVMADDQAMWRKFLGHSGVQGHQQTCELRMRRADGSIFFGNLCASFVSGEGGLPELRIALADVSGRKCAEQARRQFELRLTKLTKREREVLALALSGMINKDISTHLRISQRAVENYRSRIHVKTESLSLLELSHQVATAGIALTEIGLSE
jgi:DNA-binding CsgD family transcriptional regulator